jgi:hypothetical protein
LNHEYTRERCADQQQLQETLPVPHGSHLLSFTRTAVSLLLVKRPSWIDSYEGLAIPSPHRNRPAASP